MSDDMVAVTVGEEKDARGWHVWANCEGQTVRRASVTGGTSRDPVYCVRFALLADEGWVFGASYFATEPDARAFAHRWCRFEEGIEVPS